MQHFHRESDIFVCCLLLEETEILEYHADLLSDRRDFPAADPGDVLAREQDPAFVRLYLLEYESYKCSLACAARAYKKDKIASVDVNRRVYKSDVFAVFLGYISEFYHCVKALFMYECRPPAAHSVKFP